MTTHEPQPAPTSQIEGQLQDLADMFSVDARVGVAELLGETDATKESADTVIRATLDIVNATILAIRCGLPDERVRSIVNDACANPAPYDADTYTYRVDATSPI